MVFIATTHEYEAGLGKKLIRERRIPGQIKYTNTKNFFPEFKEKIGITLSHYVRYAGLRRKKKPTKY